VWDVLRYQLDMVGLTQPYHAQHRFWNQTPGEGLDSLLFRSYPGCEAQGGCGDTHKSPAERRCVGVLCGEREGRLHATANRWGEGSDCCVCLCTDGVVLCCWTLLVMDWP